MKRSLMRSSVFAAGLLVGVALVELAIRLVGQPIGDLRGLHVARPDRDWLYGLRPGVELRMTDPGDAIYRINRDGFRDRVHPRSKPKDSFRVLVLGDSVGFGLGVDEEETFVRLLAVELAPAGVEVLNFAVPGYNAYNEEALLLDLALDYRPDLVLVQFCVNDLNDPTLHFDRQTRLALGAIPDAAFPNPAERSMLPRTASPLGFCRALQVCRRLERAIGLDGPGTLDNRSLRLSLALRQDLAAGVERDWLLTRYRAMARASRAAGAEFAVIAFPHEGEVRGVVSPQLQSDLVGLGREGGWETLELLPAMRAAAEVVDDTLYFDPWHPTPAGHALAARALARELRVRRLVPQSPVPRSSPGQ